MSASDKITPAARALKRSVVGWFAFLNLCEWWIYKSSQGQGSIDLVQRQTLMKSGGRPPRHEAARIAKMAAMRMSRVPPSEDSAKLASGSVSGDGVSIMVSRDSMSCDK